MIPDEDPDYEPVGEAWPAMAAREREAILQPPKPDLGPPEPVAARAAEPASRGDMEAEPG